jgi:CheY-like chemotaxis protein
VNNQLSLCPCQSKRGLRLKNKANILIVDDDIEMTETLSDILTDLGHHVEIANDGFKAIQKAKTQTFDVILMDIKMPAMNGVETCKKIKHIQPKVAVMMMTAYSVEDLVAEALKEGAYGVWYKPVEIEKVIELVEHSREKGALILIVDDDLSTCETLADILKEKGYSITHVSSGKEAIKIVKEKNFDIVLIDVKMPVMNGLETYLALRKIRPDIKVVMMTAYRQEAQNLVEEAIRHDAYTCIYKPLDIKKLLKIIEGILAAKTKAEIQQIVVD